MTPHLGGPKRTRGLSHWGKRLSLMENRRQWEQYISFTDFRALGSDSTCYHDKPDPYKVKYHRSILAIATMTSWLNRDQFLTQLQNDQARHVQSAPCPSDFSEGRSYWIEEYAIDFEEQCRDTPLAEDVDVVIIGTGITGAACLYTLTARNPQLKVAVVEARGICTGATGRNGGHICRAEGTDLRALVEELGQEEALRLSLLGIRNRDLMLEAIDNLGIADEIDLQLTGTRVVFATDEERQTYLAELDYAKELGVSFEGHLMESEELCKVCANC